MARIEALSMLTTDGGKAYLAETYGKVIENISTDNLSQTIKNNELSGDPDSGTVVAKRYANAEVAAYGTARAGGQGKKTKELEVTVAIDDDIEFIEEVEEKDARLVGVDNLITRRANNQQTSLGKYLETKFWSVSAGAGQVFVPPVSADTDIKVIDAIITKIHKTKNKFVNGVPKEMIHIICESEVFSNIRGYLDMVPTANITTAEAEVGKYHGAFVHDSVDLPDGVKAIGYVNGSTAQPAMPTIADPEKIQMSNAYACGLFASLGTKCVTPDLVQVWTAGTLTIECSTISGGKTDVTLSEDLLDGAEVYLKTAANVTAPAVGRAISDASGYSKVTSLEGISATATQKLAIAEVKDGVVSRVSNVVTLA